MAQLRNLLFVIEPADRNRKTILDNLDCSVVALKPTGFESPVKLEE